MSRLLKFRAWDKEKDAWFPFDHLEMLAIFNLHDSHYSNEGLRATPNLIFSQFTGLLDKNKNEIFEGDLLRVHSHDKDHDGQLMAVEWGKFGWTVKSKNWYSLTDHDKFSIVGNIYENPGLL